MLDAGFPLLEALNLVHEQLPVGKLKDAVLSIRTDVSEGKSLSQALGEYPQYYNAFYINLVKAGEMSGSLSAVLFRLATTLEVRQELRSKMISALIYPSIMLLTSIGVVVFLLVVVIPNVTQLFIDAEHALPGATAFLIVLSQFLSEWGWLLLIVIVTSMVGMSVFVKTPRGRNWMESALLKFSLTKQLVTQRVSETLALLLESGVTIILALDITAKSTGFSRVEFGLREVSKKVAQGDGLADSLQAVGYFPHLDLRMIHAGELSGNLEKMLRRVADGESQNLSQATERFMGILEPVIVLFMGLVVGFVAIAVMLPIFEMNQLIS